MVRPWIASGVEWVAFACHVLPKPMSVDELIERFSSPDPVPTPEEMQAIVRDGILAEARAEEGWTDESWHGEPQAG